MTPASLTNPSLPNAAKPSAPLALRPHEVRLDTILLYGTFGLLMFGPLAFGAVEPWATFVLQSGATLLLLLWLGKQIRRGELNIQGHPLFLPMGVFGLLIGLQVLFHRSSYRHDTISAALQYCAYAMLCFVASQTVRRVSQARKLAVILSIYGAAIATFALLQGLSPNGKLYWLRRPRLGGWIYGPYVNHNHYAGLMETLVPIPLVLCLSHLAGTKARVAAGAAAAVMAGTIFLSGSRGGMLAFIGEMVVLAVVLVQRRRGMRSALTAGAILALLISLLAWVGGSELNRRMRSIGSETRTELSGGMRASIARDSLRMFAKKPILGWGLAAFPVVYPQFRSFYTNFFINEAHNDYLQLLVEMGALGFLTMLWFLVTLYRRAFSKLGDWMSDTNGAVALACMLGISGILVHSVVDFNLHIPANAALFYVLGTIAAAPPLAQRARRRHSVRYQNPAGLGFSDSASAPACRT